MLLGVLPNHKGGRRSRVSLSDEEPVPAEIGSPSPHHRPQQQQHSWQGDLEAGGAFRGSDGDRLEVSGWVATGGGSADGKEEVVALTSCAAACCSGGGRARAAAAT